MLTVMGIARLFLFSSVLFLGSGIAFAQATPEQLPTEKPIVYDGKKPEKEDKARLRDLSGVVKDDGGAPIDGAIVQLKNTKSGKMIDFITKQNGSYEFHELSMDIDYELTAKRDGFGEPIKKKLSKYDSRKPATLNFELARTKKAS
jgi:hypothetical protein